jgi:hypothetical protein
MKHTVATCACLLAAPPQQRLVDAELDAAHGRQVDGSQPRQEARGTGEGARREARAHGAGADGSVPSGKDGRLEGIIIEPEKDMHNLVLDTTQ